MDSWFVEFKRKLDELDARMERRWAAWEQRVAADEPRIGGHEQTGAMLLVEADNWGGLFEPAPVPEERILDLSAIDSEQFGATHLVVADNWGGLFDGDGELVTAGVDAPVVADNWGDLFVESPAFVHEPDPALDNISTDVSSARLTPISYSAVSEIEPMEFQLQIQEHEEKLEVVEADEKVLPSTSCEEIKVIVSALDRDSLAQGDFSAPRPPRRGPLSPPLFRQPRLTPLRPSRLRRLRRSPPRLLRFRRPRRGGPPRRPRRRSFPPRPPWPRRLRCLPPCPPRLRWRGRGTHRRGRPPRLWVRRARPRPRPRPLRGAPRDPRRRRPLGRLIWRPAWRFASCGRRPRRRDRMRRCGSVSAMSHIVPPDAEVWASYVSTYHELARRTSPRQQLTGVRACFLCLNLANNRSPNDMRAATLSSAAWAGPAPRAAYVDAVSSIGCVVTTPTGVDRIYLTLCARRNIVLAAGVGDIYGEVADAAVELLIDKLHCIAAAGCCVRVGLWPAQGNTQEASDPPLQLQLVVSDEDAEVPSILHIRCSTNGLILIQCCFSHPYCYRWNAVLQRQHTPWSPPTEIEMVSFDAGPRPLPWLLFNTVERNSVTCLLGQHWKPPWYEPIQLTLRCVLAELLVSYECLMIICWNSGATKISLQMSEHMASVDAACSHCFVEISDFSEFDNGRRAQPEALVTAAHGSDNNSHSGFILLPQPMPLAWDPGGLEQIIFPWSLFFAQLEWYLAISPEFSKVSSNERICKCSVFLELPWMCCWNYGPIHLLDGMINVPVVLLPQTFMLLAQQQGALFSVECYCSVNCGSLHHVLQLLLVVGKIQRNSYLSGVHTSDKFMFLLLSWLTSVWACSLVFLWYHLQLSVSVDGSIHTDVVHITDAYKVLKLQHKFSPQGVLVKLETLWEPSAWRRVVLYSDSAYCQKNELIARDHALIKDVARKYSGAECVSFQKLFVHSQQEYAWLFGDRLFTEAYIEDLHTPWDPDSSMYQYQIGNRPRLGGLVWCDAGLPFSMKDWQAPWDPGGTKMSSSAWGQAEAKGEGSVRYHFILQGRIMLTVLGTDQRTLKLCKASDQGGVMLLLKANRMLHMLVPDVVGGFAVLLQIRLLWLLLPAFQQEHPRLVQRLEDKPQFKEGGMSGTFHAMGQHRALDRVA